MVKCFNCDNKMTIILKIIENNRKIEEYACIKCGSRLKTVYSNYKEEWFKG